MGERAVRSQGKWSNVALIHRKNYKPQIFIDEVWQCLVDKYVITYQNIWGECMVNIVGTPKIRTFQKLSHLEGGRGGGRGWNFLLERGDKPEKGGGGVDVEMGGLSLFYYFTVQSQLLCVWEN